MRIQSSARKSLVITILLVSANVGAETWELRPAAGSAPGTTEIEAGRIDDAIRILTLELDSRSSDTYLVVLENLCVAYTLKLEYDTAMRYCDQAAGHSSASASMLNNRGVLRAVMDDYRGAIQDFRRAGCMRNCGRDGKCETQTIRALVRRNFTRVKQREASSYLDAVLFQPRV